MAAGLTEGKPSHERGPAALRELAKPNFDLLAKPPTRAGNGSSTGGASARCSSCVREHAAMTAAERRRAIAAVMALARRPTPVRTTSGLVDYYRKLERLRK
jgi:hypothetical protein